MMKISKKQLDWANSQPGNLYDQIQRFYPGHKNYHVKLPGNIGSVKDVYISLVYSGDMAAIYSNGLLTYDDFNYGGPLKFRLNTLNLTHEADIQLFPAKKTSNVFVEDQFKARYRNGSNPRISKIGFLPLYEVVVNVKTISTTEYQGINPQK